MQNDPRHTTANESSPPLANARIEMVRATFHIPRVIYEEIRGTVVDLSGPGVYMTLSEFVTTALKRRLIQERRAYNHGLQFEPITSPLKGGRPPKGSKTTP